MDLLHALRAYWKRIFGKKPSGSSFFSHNKKQVVASFKGSWSNHNASNIAQFIRCKHSKGQQAPSSFVRELDSYFTGCDAKFTTCEIHQVCCDTHARTINFRLNILQLARSVFFKIRFLCWTFDNNWLLFCLTLYNCETLLGKDQNRMSKPNALEVFRLIQNSEE